MWEKKDNIRDHHISQLLHTHHIRNDNICGTEQTFGDLIYNAV